MRSPYERIARWIVECNAALAEGSHDRLRRTVVEMTNEMIEAYHEEEKDAEYRALAHPKVGQS